ncbi:MAG: hypothetical protein RR404_02955 [Bacilli bacterium]
MKKIVIILIISILLTGCGKIKPKTLEQQLETMATDYYSKYMINNGLDVAIVSLKELKEANETMSETYDLSKFSQCDLSTKVKITIKKGTNQIENYKFELNCK